MPVLKHAKKKLRQDKARTERNKKVKDLYKKLVKEAKATKKAAAVNKAFSSIDKAAKHHILPKNRAARIKAALSKVVEGKAPTTPAAKPKTKVVKKPIKKAAAKKK
ncbi:MAG TPA: 30S ribosomal protein S20 [Patescibacteria group bacterium]|nr:30S ribosomal protein S20 [Patescibacteria group bacterium]